MRRADGQPTPVHLHHVPVHHRLCPAQHSHARLLLYDPVQAARAQAKNRFVAAGQPHPPAAHHDHDLTAGPTVPGLLDALLDRHAFCDVHRRAMVGSLDPVRAPDHPHAGLSEFGRQLDTVRLVQSPATAADQ